MEEKDGRSINATTLPQLSEESALPQNLNDGSTADTGKEPDNHDGPQVSDTLDPNITPAQILLLMQSSQQQQEEQVVVNEPVTNELPPIPTGPEEMEDANSSPLKTPKKRGRKRKRPIDDTMEGEPVKKKAKQTRGLSYFAKIVCDRVKEKEKSTFAEIANVIVAEYCDKSNPKDGIVQEEKNVRRRVYDALNVLTALSIITKNRKEISWSGYPLGLANEFNGLNNNLRSTRNDIEDKKRQLKEICRQKSALEQLLERNTKEEYQQVEDKNRVKLPFILVHTDKNTVVECQMDDDAHECFFNFSEPFEIHDDNEVIKRIFLKDETPMPMNPYGSIDMNLMPQHSSLPPQMHQNNVPMTPPIPLPMDEGVLQPQPPQVMQPMGVPVPVPVPSLSLTEHVNLPSVQALPHLPVLPQLPGGADELKM